MSKKVKNRFRILICVIFVSALIFIVWSPLTLTKISDRKIKYCPDKSLREEIREETSNMSADDILNYSIKKTARLLSFSVKNNLSDGEANCVGYAQVCAGIGNYAFKINGINASAKPVFGYVMFYGTNVCNMLKYCMPNKRWENFVKDHDFVEYNIDGQTIYVDASAYDLILKDCKTVN